MEFNLWSLIKQNLVAYIEYATGLSAVTETQNFAGNLILKCVRTSF